MLLCFFQIKLNLLCKRMGGVESCCGEQKDDVLMVTKMDLSHCGCIEVPNIVFSAERCIETLILASNQILSLPPQLFHCQELKHLNLNDNCISSIPPAIGSLVHLVSLKIDKNNVKDLPENLKCCRKLKRLSLNNNQWKQVPSIATQLISLEELYMNDCELSFLPASVGRLTKLKILELRNNNLCNLPLAMNRLTTLCRLDIGDNDFMEFPACINSLRSLTELLIDNNDIEEITDIRNLVNLEHLDASYNHISHISETVGCCTNLNMLNLSFNYLEQLPDSLGNIEKLETLHLEMNELTEVPKTIGKLKGLEDLNISNNRLCNIPISIGLLRNLRNLNLSRNTIEEFPPEIGSCTKLSIINAGYNRLQVLPSEIGYLNNLKVLDLVGNFLMYLPITIINLRSIRAIWLSANQNVPLIPFTEDLNIASGERFLTNIALPQLGEIPFYNQNNIENIPVLNEKSSSWNKKIRFAEDDDILPGKLHRTPTPFPKELRAPNRKPHIRSENLKNNDNYVNLIDGKACDTELHPPTFPITKNGSGLLNFTESCITMIREANIRKNHRDTNSEENSLRNQSSTMDEKCVQDLKVRESPVVESTYAVSDSVKNIPKALHDEEKNYGKALKSPIREVPLQEEKISVRSQEEQAPRGNAPEEEKSLKRTCIERIHVDRNGEKIIYSNLNNQKEETERTPTPQHMEFNNVDAQAIRGMYHNDIISGREATLKSNNKFFPYAPFRASVKNDFQEPPPVHSRPYHLNLAHVTEAKGVPLVSDYYPQNNGLCPDMANEGVPRADSEKAMYQQDQTTVKMRNRNLSPPCYEIAKMYSTKAALFEQNRIDHCN